MERNKGKLQELFNTLQHCNDQTEIKNLQAKIWDIWLRHPSGKAKEAFRSGVEHLNNADFNLAIDCFGQAIEKDPAFAEAYNKRATAYYQRGNFKQSIEDIGKTLEIEPKHFGALTGLASIYIEMQEEARALMVLRQIEQISPYDQNLLKQIEVLEERING